MKLSNQIRNQMISQYETVLGTNPVLELRTGTTPTTCESPDQGVLLCSITLPNDWLTTPTTGTVTLQGGWNGSGVAQGTIGHYRLKTALGVCHEQGTVYQTGGAGDLEVDNTTIATNQIVQVITWTRTQGGQ